MSLADKLAGSLEQAELDPTIGATSPLRTSRARFTRG